MQVLEQYGFRVVVVFDGERPLSKIVYEKRTNARLTNLNAYIVADQKGNTRAAAQALRRLVVPTATMFNNVKAALIAANIAIKTAPFEAEKQIAYDVCQVTKKKKKKKMQRTINGKHRCVAAIFIIHLFICDVYVCRFFICL